MLRTLAFLDSKINYLYLDITFIPKLIMAD